MNKLSVCAALFVVALLTTSSASPSPVAGINLTVAPVTVALKGLDPYTGVATLSFVTAARWNPEAVSEAIDVEIKDVTAGGVDHVTGGILGGAPHFSNRYTELAAGFAGHKLEFTATWNVYNIGGDSGVDTSPTTTFTVPKKESTRRLRGGEKQDAYSKASQAFGLASTLAAMGAGAVASGLGAPAGIFLGAAAASCYAVGVYKQRIANDPIDLNFRSIAKPKIPTVPEITAGEGMPAASARALNEFLAVQAREIGYARAVATAFDRSQGAHLKKDTDWEKKQVRAAGTYASQLAASLLAEASLWPKVKAALADSAFADLRLTYEDALAFGESLVWKGLPGAMTAQLKKLGVTRADQREIRAQAATIDPGLYDGAVLSALPNSRDVANMRKLAASLRAFAKRAAKDPLNTGN